MDIVILDDRENVLGSLSVTGTLWIACDNNTMSNVDSIRVPVTQKGWPKSFKIGNVCGKFRNEIPFVVIGNYIYITERQLAIELLAK
jgi:hypothetical protein